MVFFEILSAAGVIMLFVNFWVGVKILIAMAVLFVVGVIFCELFT